MNLSHCDVTELLKQWGAWSRSDLGSGSLEQPLHDNTHWINDEIGLWIDSAVSKLKLVDRTKKQLDAVKQYKRHSPRHTAVLLYYKDNYNIPMLANALKCGEPKATMILKSGESFIEAELGLHEQIA